MQAPPAPAEPRASTRDAKTRNNRAVPVRDLTALADQALLLSIAVSIPVIALAALASLAVSVVQAVTQVSDSTIAHLPRLLVVGLTLTVAGPWMGAQIVAFAVRAFAGGS